MKRCEVKDHTPRSKRCRCDDDSEANHAADDDAAAAAAMVDRQQEQQRMQVKEFLRAADRNDLTTVQRLLQHDYEATICNGLSDYTIRDDDYPYDNDLVTALHVACWQGHISIVRHLLHHPSCDPNIPSMIREETALYWACRNEQENVVEELLQHPNIRLDLTDKFGNTALHGAVFGLSPSLIQRLCEYAHEWYRRRSNSSRCCSSSDRSMSESMATAKALNWINQADRDGRTALYKAVACGEVPLVQCLLDNGADDYCAERTWGRTLLHEAIVNIDFDDRINRNMVELVPFLLKEYQQKKLSTPKTNGASEIGETEVVENDQEKLLWINAADQFGRTALHYVVMKMSDRDARPQYNSLADILQFLLHHGADVTLPDFGGDTVFHMAANLDLEKQTLVFVTALCQLLRRVLPLESSGDGEEEVEELSFLTGAMMGDLPLCMQSCSLVKKWYGPCLLEFGASVDKVHPSVPPFYMIPSIPCFIEKMI